MAANIIMRGKEGEMKTEDDQMWFEIFIFEWFHKLETNELIYVLGKVLLHLAKRIIHESLKKKQYRPLTFTKRKSLSLSFSRSISYVR